MSRLRPSPRLLNQKTTLAFAACAAFFWAATAARSLEIPLTPGGGGGGAVVGYVDMESIFQEYPETQKAKKEYYEELANRRQILADKEKELADMKEQLAVLRATLQEMQTSLETPPPTPDATAAPVGNETLPGGSVESDRPTGNQPLPTAVSTTSFAAPTPSTTTSLVADLGVSSGSLAAVQESLLQREKLLAEKESDLEKSRSEAVQALKELEERRSLQIFGKLYHALRQLADENGVTLVVDKSSVLYGQNAVDLTERLRRRVRGLPDQ